MTYGNYYKNAEEMDPNGKSAFMGTRVNGNTLENNFFFFLPHR